VTIAIVQTGSTPGFSASSAFGTGITLGNWLVINGTAYSTATPPPSNTASPTVGGVTPVGGLQLLSQQSPNTTDNVYGTTWLLPVTAAIAGGTAVAMTFLNSSGAVGVGAYEISGLGASPVADRSLSGDAATAAVTSGTTAAIRTGPELIVAWNVVYGQAQGGGPSSGGFTSIDLSGGDGFSYSGIQVASAGGGTYVYSDTAGAAANWAAGIVTIAAALPAAVGRPLVLSQAVKRSYFW
jgi:hypothetical protein